MFQHHFGIPHVVELHPAVQRRRDVGLASHTSMIALRVATANVLSFFPGQDFASGFLGTRAEDLAQQFLNENLHIIGLRETRARLQEHHNFEDFHVLSATATSSGRGGVQLWLHNQVQCGA